MSGDHSPPSALPHLMTRREVADLFRRTPRTISAWIAAGILKPIYRGKSVYFRTEDIEKMLEGE